MKTRQVYNYINNEKRFKLRRRFAVRPRFFVILTAFFAVLAVCFFSLAGAQAARLSADKHIASADGSTVTPIIDTNPGSSGADSTNGSPDSNADSQSGTPQNGNTQSPDNEQGSEDVPTGITSQTLENAACYVMIDPGHGGQDGGCVHGTLKESNLDLTIARHVRDILQEKGIGVLMTREDDTLPSGKQLSGLYLRATMCNKSNAVCFVSIHANSFSDSSVHGMDCYFNGTTNSKSENFAQLVLDNTTDETSAKNRGLFSDSELVVTREVKVPSCLLEVGFVTNPDEFNNLNSEAYQKKVAKGIANGIIEFLLQEGLVKEVNE